MDLFNFFAIFGLLVAMLIVIYLIFTIINMWKVFFEPHFADSPLDLVKKFGSWAVVTGSTDGIGKAYARELAKRGVNIVLISRTLQKLETVAAEITNEFNVKTKIIVADFCEGRSVFSHVENELKNIPVGILVNNVVMNVNHPMFYDEMSSDFILNTINVNVATALMMTRMILPQMKKQRQGVIVNISSILELFPLPLFSMYGASKAFMKSFTYSLDAECQPFDITVQLLSPSFLKTNLTKFSNFIQGFYDFYITDPTTFVRHAIDTLGVAKHTTGYFPHEITYWLAEVFLSSMKLKQWIAIQCGKQLRNEHKQMQLKQKC